MFFWETAMLFSSVIGIEHLFLCLLTICIPSLEKCLSRLSVHFKIRLFVFLMLSYTSYLYILGINLLQIFSPIKNRTTIWPSNFTLKYIFKEKKNKIMNANLKRWVHPSVHSISICNRQDIEATWVHKRWMDKDVMCACVHTHTQTHTPWNTTQP